VRLTSRRWRFFELILPWVVLIFLASFTYDLFVKVPYAGFEFAEGKIIGIYKTEPGQDTLQIGDRLIQVGQVTWDDFQHDLRLSLFKGVSPGQLVPMIVERDGNILTLQWEFPGPTNREILERLNSQWWMIYVFWLAGTAALLFMRPKDTPWLLLIALSYLTALWLAAGSGPSHWHVDESAVLMRAAIWICLPVYLHFHWIIIKPLAKLLLLLWVALYLGASLMAVAEWLQVTSPQTFYWGGLLALAGSVILLCLHFILQPEYRREVLIPVIGVGLALLPLVGVDIAILSGFTPSRFIQGGSFLALPAIPGAYFYTVFRSQQKGMERRAKRLVTLFLITILAGILFLPLYSFLEARFNLEQSTFAVGFTSILLGGIIATTTFLPFLALSSLAESTQVRIFQPKQFVLRANRLISYYLFIILGGGLLAILIFFADTWLDFPRKATIIGMAAALCAGLFTLVGLAPFQRFVEHRLLGIPLPPTRLLETYATRITTSLNLPSLIHLLKDEILPSLFIRQSALIQLEDGRSTKTLYATGINQEGLPGDQDITRLLKVTEGYRPSPTSGEENRLCAWIRVILPLQVGDEVIGLWLLGNRDPDDLYSSSEISILNAIANQTAVALVNIKHTERLHALYQADIERQEKDRATLALGLHDEVLNQLAALTMRNDHLRTAPGFQESYQLLTSYLRSVINDLRPTMLAYGLRPSLEELVDQLQERDLGDTEIHLEVPPSDSRYDPQLEQHVFRIVQQACENALRHGHSKNIRIYGDLNPDRVHLTVEDDGVGFPSGEHLDLNQLLAAKHYGLVGMHERADLISAQLKIKSSPGTGTIVSVICSLDADDPQ
jgi:signal transduction histidine kinase